MNQPMNQPKPDIYNAACPSRQMLSRIGDKWAVMILGVLKQQPIRFGALKRMCDGISQKMLTQTLRNLERDGLVNRRVITVKPLQVEYALTETGVSLLSLLNPLIDWVHAMCMQIDQSQKTYDSKHSSLIVEIHDKSAIV